MSLEGWKIFKTLSDFKKTFILPDKNQCVPDASNSCLRILKMGNILYILHLSFKFHPKELRTPMDDGVMYWTLLYVDMDKELCEHFNSQQGQTLAPFIYSLMCFVELCDNEEVIVKPKEKHGTRKEGKIINILPFPITIINNTWNIKTIRTEGFPVSGHVALRWTGAGRTVPKIVYIEPYMKDGYTRRSGKELSNS